MTMPSKMTDGLGTDVWADLEGLMRLDRDPSKTIVGIEADNQAGQGTFSVALSRPSYLNPGAGNRKIAFPDGQTNWL